MFRNFFFLTRLRGRFFFCFIAYCFYYLPCMIVCCLSGVIKDNNFALKFTRIWNFKRKHFLDGAPALPNPFSTPNLTMKLTLTVYECTPLPLPTSPLPTAKILAMPMTHLTTDIVGFYLFLIYYQLLSSISCGNLVVPRTRRRIGNRAFSVAAPRAWNRLPTELKLLRSTVTGCYFVLLTL